MLPEIMLDISSSQTSSNFIKSANHLNVICRNKAILERFYSKQWLIFVHSGGDKNPKHDLRGMARASSWLEYVLC